MNIEQIYREESARILATLIRLDHDEMCAPVGRDLSDLSGPLVGRSAHGRVIQGVAMDLVVRRERSSR